MNAPSKTKPKTADGTLISDEERAYFRDNARKTAEKFRRLGLIPEKKEKKECFWE